MAENKEEKDISKHIKVGASGTLLSAPIRSQTNSWL